MRRPVFPVTAILASTIVLAACASTPEPEPAPAPAVVAAPVVRETGTLIGLSAAELISRLGNPALQIREGNSVKLQFRNSRCVIDAYLYPAPNAPTGRVEHVDTRAPSGVSANQDVCVTLFLNKAN